MYARQNPLLTIFAFAMVLFAPGAVSGGNILSHSQLQVNLGPIPIDKYTQTNYDPQYGIAYVKNCSTSWTVQQCYQSLAANYYQQGVQAVRFFFAFCGGAWSTALLNCGTGYNSTSVNPQWTTNLGLFLTDLANNNIRSIIPTPGFWGAYDDNIQYCADGTYTCGEWTGQYNFIQNSLEPSLNDGLQYRQVYESCTGTTIPVFYWPAAPFAVRVISSQPDQSPTGPWRHDWNNSYNCSPSNPIFAGWGHIYDVIDAVLAAAQSRGMAVTEFDMDNEIDLVQYTVYLRLLYDNKHGDTGYAAFLDGVRWDLNSRGYNQLRQTYSSLELSPSVDSFDCISLYGDSARLLAVSAVWHAIGGGMVGTAYNYSEQNALRCGGTGPGDMPHLPVYYTQPTLIDVHNCSQYSSSDATVSFNDYKSFIDAHGNMHGADVVLGETCTGASTSCQPNSENRAWYMINGFNGSSLVNNNTTIFMPWTNPLAQCGYPFPLTINPPYSPTP